MDDPHEGNLILTADGVRLVDNEVRGGVFDGAEQMGAHLLELADLQAQANA